MKRKHRFSSYCLIWQGAWDSNPNFTDFRPRTMFPQPSFSRCGLDYVFTLPFGLGSWYIVSTHLGIASTQHGVALTFHRFSQLLLLSFPTRHSPLQSVKEKVRSLFQLEYRPIYNIRYKILCIFSFSTLRTYYSIFFRVCQDGIFKNQKKIFWSNLLPFSKNGIFVRAVAQTALNFHSYAFNFFRLVKFQVLTTFLRLWERPSANPSVYRNLIFLITNL